MYDKHYTSEKNVQIVIALLKANGIRRVIASPGTTNMTFIGSIQNDPFFKIWSSVDERSAAYLACGMAAESGEPVVISCTGATASRNYMPGLTEAFYRKLPILAITSHRGEAHIGHLLDQQIDRRTIPNDVAVKQVTIPMVDAPEDERFCEIEVTKAIIALKKNGGGPVHINMYTRYSPDFSVKNLPELKPISCYTLSDRLPSLVKGRIGIYMGSHANFTKDETKAIDAFCSSNDAVVFCDHTSGYDGAYKINFHLVQSQVHYISPLAKLDLLIHIGEVSGTAHVNGRIVWRVSPDGEVRDTFKNVSDIFMMNEIDFFSHYTDDTAPGKTDFYRACQEEYNKFYNLIPELPFGNIWMAQKVTPKLPENSELHLGIFNSLRSWNFFELPKGVLGKCNVGGFGIDGALSTMIGASLVNPSKLFFGVFGDLAFFYDMNVLGNRHVGNNLRIMLINNARGTEFRLKRHPCHIFGDDADPYMAAAGHFGNKSENLVRHYAEDLGFQYYSASDKAQFLQILDKFISPHSGDKPILFEVFTDTSDESEALEMMQNLCVDKSVLAFQSAGKIVRNMIGDKPVQIAKKILRR